MASLKRKIDKYLFLAKIVTEYELANSLAYKYKGQYYV